MKLTDQVMQKVCWVDILYHEASQQADRAAAEMQRFTWADTMLSSVNLQQMPRSMQAGLHSRMEVV